MSKKSEKMRKLKQKKREINKHIQGNTIKLDGGYVKTTMEQAEYYEHIQKTRVGCGSHKDKRRKLKEKAYLKDNFKYA